MGPSVAKRTMGDVIVLFFSMEIFRVVLGELLVRDAFVSYHYFNIFFYINMIYLFFGGGGGGGGGFHVTCCFQLSVSINR